MINIRIQICAQKNVKKLSLPSKMQARIIYEACFYLKGGITVTANTA
jgi:hypothetical protein